MLLVSKTCLPSPRLAFCPFQHGPLDIRFDSVSTSVGTSPGAAERSLRTAVVNVTDPTHYPRSLIKVLDIAVIKGIINFMSSECLVTTPLIRPPVRRVNRHSYHEQVRMTSSIPVTCMWNLVLAFTEFRYSVMNMHTYTPTVFSIWLSSATLPAARRRF